MSKEAKEWVTGIVIGLILMLLLSVKVLAATPEEAERYLSENAVEIPEEVEFWANHYGAMYGVKPEIIEAVCWVESRCTQDAQNADKSCKGLMQIKVSSHRARMQKCNVQNIFGIRENIKVGADYLAELDGERDISEALMAYNGDTNGVTRYRETGKVSKYAREVLEVSAALERLHNK